MYPVMEVHVRDVLWNVGSQPPLAQGFGLVKSQ